MNGFRFLMVGVVRAVWIIALGFVVLATQPQTIAQPVTDSGVGVALDFDGDTETDAAYEHQSVNITQGTEPYYRVTFFLRNSPQLRFVRTSKQRIDFLTGNAVSLTSQAYVGPGGGNEVTLLAYDAESRFSQWTFYDTTVGSSDMFFTNKTEVLVGFRMTSLKAGTTHHGWLRFTRPDSHFTTPFAVAGYDWNPLPGEPIAAGLPPVIPLTPQVTAEGLRLSWPAAVAAWTLEASDQLGPAAQWSPVPGVSGTEVVLAPPATSRFFRLRKP